jgi:hypothetical protein
LCRCFGFRTIWGGCRRPQRTCLDHNGAPGGGAHCTLAHTCEPGGSGLGAAAGGHRHAAGCVHGGSHLFSGSRRCGGDSLAECAQLGRGGAAASMIDEFTNHPFIQKDLGHNSNGQGGREGSTGTPPVWALHFAALRSFDWQPLALQQQQLIYGGASLDTSSSCCIPIRLHTTPYPSIYHNHRSTTTASTLCWVRGTQVGPCRTTASNSVRSSTCPRPGRPGPC